MLIQGQTPEWINLVHDVADAAVGHGHYEASELITRADDFNKSFVTGEWHASLKAPLTNSNVGEFKDFEDLWAAVMESAWLAAGKYAYAVFADEDPPLTLKNSADRPFDFDKFQDDARKLADRMSNVLTEKDIENLTRISEQAVRRGGQVAQAQQLLISHPKYLDIVETMVRSSRYYTNQFFNSQVMPKLYDAVEKAMQTGLNADSTIWTQVQEELRKRLLKRTPYWHTVANAAASRAYHHGLIKAGVMNGYRGYRLVNPLDKKTSKICRSLHGREFWLVDAEELYDNIIENSEEELKNSHPWITGEEARALTEDEVFSRAVYVPPFHGNCRTTMQLLRA